MKSRITLSIVLALSVVLVSMITTDPTVSAATAQTYVADTGMITLGPNQILRLTAANTAGQRSGASDVANIRFTDVLPSATCNSDGVCTHTVTTQTTTAPVTLAPGQAASHDITQPASASAVRGLVIGDSPDMLVNALIIDGTTGAVVGYIGGVRVGSVDR